MEPSIEDERGVDITALQRRLALTPAERVQLLVDEVEVWTQMLASARRSDERFDV